MTTPDLTDPLPAPGAPHAYVAVQRTHSPYADRPEWSHRAYVIPAWDEQEIDNAMRSGDTLLPIGPDGDTGTRAIVEARVIETPEEAQALPGDAVVVAHDARVWIKDADLDWVCVSTGESATDSTLPLPARVLFDPTQEGQADA